MLFRLALVAALAFGIQLTPADARGRSYSSHSSRSYSTRSYSSHTYRAPRATTPRVYYGGGKHTVSHGGTYVGGTGGSSHKGGHYVNPRTNNHYGRHK